MRTLPIFLLGISLALGPSGPAWAKHQHDHVHEEPAAASEPAAPVSVQPDEVVIDVHGMVCSICAFGLWKRLSKLEFVDQSRFKDGVQTDIKSHLVRLAVKPGMTANLKQVYQEIKEGGYDAVTFTRLENGEPVQLDAAQVQALP